VSSGSVLLPGRLQTLLSGVWGGPDNESYLADPSHPYALYDPSMFGEGGKLSNDLFPLYAKRTTDGGFVPPPSDLDNLNQRALRTMMPVIKAELSLVNSILELKDFKSLPNTIRKLSELPSLFNLKTPVSLLRYPGKSLATFQKPLREWFRGAADSYLQASFNILPLLSDIAGIQKAISRTERRINDFITRAGCFQRKHFTVFLNEGERDLTDSFEVPATGFTTEGDLHGTTLKVTRYSNLVSKFHAEIEFNYNYTRYQIEHARLLSLLDAVGINFNPAIIWNAVPWSFVVDWVAGVGQWLNKQRIGLMDPQINIHRYLWSIQRARVIRMGRQSVNSVYGYGGAPYITSPTVLSPAISEFSFRRNSGLPSEGSIITSGLSIKEFSLAAALVIARKWQRKRRVSWATYYKFPG
jgi:hypothetical protein